MKDDRYFNADGSRLGDAALTPAGRQPSTTTPFGPSLYGVYGEDWITLDFHYALELINWDATLTASIDNIADDMPNTAPLFWGVTNSSVAFWEPT